MKALVLEEVGKLIFKDVALPIIKSGEALVEIKSCGICSSDFDRCLKTGTYHFPTIPGHEFSGRIVAVGEEVDGALVGKRCVVFPLLPCRECDQCKIEAYARCRNYNYFGSRCDGAFAEYLAVPIWNIQIFDDSLDYRVAALCEPASVAYHAAKAAEIKAGDSVCIVGTGTIGILAGLWAREAGGEVVFVSRSERKNDFIRSFGFDGFLAPAGTDGHCFDKVIECVGSNDSLSDAILRVNSAGTVVLVGNPDMDKVMSRKTYWKILRGEITVKGVWNSSYTSSNNEWQEVLRVLEKKQEMFSKLVTSTFPLSAGLDAFAAMKNGKTLQIKGMFVNE